jgi:hypothetical protein
MSSKSAVFGVIFFAAMFVCEGCTQQQANKPSQGFVALFNGKDLTGWKGLVADPIKRAQMNAEEMLTAQTRADELMRKNWKVIDGALIYDGNGFDNICTAADYNDFELLVDWKIETNSDSGIYLRGSPQVQIWDVAKNGIGSGGLFNNKKGKSKPLKIVDRPAGEWNTFRIIMTGKRVIVYLNGELVVDDVPLENYWEADKPIYPTGPIELQAHRTRVYFRNIFLREIQLDVGQSR